jgi:hypothetical protein
LTGFFFLAFLTGTGAPQGCFEYPYESCGPAECSFRLRVPHAFMVTGAHADASDSR